MRPQALWMNEESFPKEVTSYAASGSQSDPRLLSSLSVFSKAASLVVVVIGSLVLVGWIFNIGALKTVFRDMVAMNPTTAVNFILAGLALRLLQSANTKSSAHRIGRWIGVLVAVVGLVKLGEYFNFFDIDIDQLLFRAKLGSNVMAPNTALSFVFVGFALWLLDVETRRGNHPAEALAFLPAFLSLIALLGYAYSVQSFYTVGEFIPMALPTAATFQLFSFGILCARPDRGQMKIFTAADAGGVMMRRLLPVVVLILLSQGWLQLAGERRGLFSSEFGEVLQAAMSVVVFTLLIGRISKALQRIDAKRRQAAEAVRRSETKFRTLYEATSDAVMLLTDKGFFDCNPTTLAVFGCASREEFCSKHPADLSPPQQPDGTDSLTLAKQRINTAMETGTLRFEWMHQRANTGEVFPAEVLLNRMQLDGQPVLQAVVHEITERKAAQDEIFRLKEGLEERVRVRTTQLRESETSLTRTLAELQETQQQVVQQERLRALGTMASGIAHDFNNSLTTILGGSELLLHQPGALDNKETARSYLELMNTAAQDARSVVNRLRDFYRHREKNEAFAPVDLNKLVNEAISLTQAKWKTEAEVQGVSVNVHTDLQVVPIITGNASELRQVLTNLIFNAVDAMPRSGTITIHTYHDERYVVLEISDTGTGMTQEVRRHCLDPFFTTKGEHGTGLGLSMVYGIIQRHQGTVDIETEVGKGTTFIIRLPVQTAQPQSEPKPQPVDVVQHLHVLVVDDEAVVRKIIGDYLKIDGHIVEAANSGRDALEKFRNSRFDLVLLDRAMPDMSGDQVAAAIKFTNPAMPVIMLTGFGSMMDAADEKPTGVDFIVGKPVTINALRAALSRAVASVN